MRDHYKKSGKKKSIQNSLRRNMRRLSRSLNRIAILESRSPEGSRNVISTYEYRQSLRMIPNIRDLAIDMEFLAIEIVKHRDPPTLECMSSHFDGSHCGLSDWYEEIETGIQNALNTDSEWTTGWYASKKEIASARITSTDSIKVEVSVSDDFDTEGIGMVEIPLTKDLDLVRCAIEDAWESAEQDQAENRQYVGYSILTLRSYEPAQKTTFRYQCCVDIYLKASGFMWDDDCPPGDSYHHWGFQGEYDIPEDVKEKLEEWAQENDFGEFTFGGFTIKSWCSEEI